MPSSTQPDSNQATQAPGPKGPDTWQFTDWAMI